MPHTCVDCHKLLPPGVFGLCDRCVEEERIVDAQWFEPEEPPYDPFWDDPPEFSNYQE